MYAMAKQETKRLCARYSVYNANWMEVFSLVFLLVPCAPRTKCTTVSEKHIGDGTDDDDGDVEAHRK